ncbi:hypothetical protein HY798_00040 [Candidatus Falkowbacteria bacterium]|nr:hypothetical protein [Candidatus Falkowbacteria bacterium]
MSSKEAQDIIKEVEGKSGGYFLVEAAIGKRISYDEFLGYLKAQAVLRQAPQVELAHA